MQTARPVLGSAEAAPVSQTELMRETPVGLAAVPASAMGAEELLFRAAEDSANVEGRAATNVEEKLESGLVMEWVREDAT
jgi:hypothetical protein